MSLFTVGPTILLYSALNFTKKKIKSDDEKTQRKKENSKDAELDNKYYQKKDNPINPRLNLSTRSEETNLQRPSTQAQT